MLAMASLPGGRPGTVKAWIEERGMGFIAPADGSPDVFVHRSNLTDGNALVIGSEVFYEPGWDDSKSKPIAAKCSGATTLNGGALIRRAPGPGPPLANGQPGTVKAWLDDRGMGFISPADGGADVFVHRSNLLDGNCLSVGAQVMFEAGWDESKAKPLLKRSVVPQWLPPCQERAAGVLRRSPTGSMEWSRLGSRREAWDSLHQPTAVQTYSSIGAI